MPDLLSPRRECPRVTMFSYCTLLFWKSQAQNKKGPKIVLEPFKREIMETIIYKREYFWKEYFPMEGLIWSVKRWDRPGRIRELAITCPLAPRNADFSHRMRYYGRRKILSEIWIWIPIKPWAIWSFPRTRP